MERSVTQSSSTARHPNQVSAKISQIKSYVDYIYKLDYVERPVSFIEFVSSPHYLGALTDNGRGVYPIWKKAMTRIMEEDSKYSIVLTGGIGIGKTRAAIYGMCYVMYRGMCLKDPWKMYSLTAGGKLIVAFFNLTKTLGASKGFNLLQAHLTKSPWFLERGVIRGQVTPYLDLPRYEFRIGSPYSKGFGVQGEDVFTALLDEVDSPGESRVQKEKTLKMYSSAALRFQSRFVVDEESLGKLFIVASKQEELSFLNTYIEEHKGAKEVLVVDVPIWEAKASSNYCGDKFEVIVGDVYTPPKILVAEEEKAAAVASGFKIIQVPVEYRTSFERDIVGSLRDLAGISANSMRKSKFFPSEQTVAKCFDETKPDPISKPLVVTGMNRRLDLIQFVDMSKFRTPLHVPRFIHYDIAFAGGGDTIGLACSGVSGWAPVTKEELDGSMYQQNAPVVETDFAMRITADPGDEVPLSSIRKLILDLKGRGLNIHVVTADLRLLSADTMQILTNAGITCDYLSLDRTPKYYGIFKDLVDDSRWVCHPHLLLNLELVNLEQDPVTGKVDHPDKIQHMQFVNGNVEDIILDGSKDLSDAVAGSAARCAEAIEVPPDVASMKGMFSTKAERAGNSAALMSSDIYSYFPKASGTILKRSEPGLDANMKGFRTVLKRAKK